MIISEREFPLHDKSNFLDIMYVAEVIIRVVSFMGDKRVVNRKTKS